MPAEATWTAEAAALDRLIEATVAGLIRGSASRELVDRRGFSAAVVDGSGRVASASEHAPIANLEALARTAAERFPQLPGDDVLLTNDPYSGGTRVQDHFAIAPFADPTGGRGYAIVSAALADVGGMTLGNEFAAAGDLWTEGVRTTPIRIVRGGQVDADAERLLAINSRLPLLVVADAKMVAAAAASLAAATPDLLGSGAAAGRIGLSRDALAARLAEGGSAAGAASAGPASELRLSITASGGRLEFDFSGSAEAQRDNNGNATAATVASAVIAALGRALDCPLNSGLAEAAAVAVPAGSCLDAQFPLPVGAGRFELGDAIAELTSDLLGAVVAER